MYTSFANPAGRRAAWSFLKPNFDGVVAKAGTVLANQIVGVTAMACEADLIADMEAFFKAKNVPGAERTLEQGVERGRACVDLRQRQQDILHGWLARRATADR